MCAHAHASVRQIETVQKYGRLFHTASLFHDWGRQGSLILTNTRAHTHTHLNLYGKHSHIVKMYIAKRVAVG